MRFALRSAPSRGTTVRVVVKDNQKVGQFTVSFVDLDVPVSGLPIRVTRTYDSRDKGRGDFGFGWKLDISSLEIEDSGVLGQLFSGTKSIAAFPTYCLPPLLPLG